MEPNRFYVYKCVVDDGAAPCVDDNILTLTICKPQIRSTAKHRNLIFAFGSNTEAPPNRLVYIAQVSRRMPSAEYFGGNEFRHRRDAIYERTPDGQLTLRTDAQVHTDADHRPRDVGIPPKYQRANALVCNDFRYFGRNGRDDWKSRAPLLTALVEGLGQGHRVNFTPALAQELQSLKEWAWEQYPQTKVLGTPLHRTGEIADDDKDETVEICKEHCRYCGTRKKAD
jgi:hypothetical protein